MLREDERRLQREADIAKAVRGPDYMESSSSAGKSFWDKIPQFDDFL